MCRKGLVTAQERTLGRCHSCPADLNVELLDSLRAWRLETAREQEVPAYIVFGDATLRGIAVTEPTTLEQLSTVSGVGEKKLEAYGAQLLELIGAGADDGERVE